MSTSHVIVNDWNISYMSLQLMNFSQMCQTSPADVIPHHVDSMSTDTFIPQFYKNVSFIPIHHQGFQWSCRKIIIILSSSSSSSSSSSCSCSSTVLLSDCTCDPLYSCVFLPRRPADGRHTIPDDGQQIWERLRQRTPRGTTAWHLKPVGLAVWSWICLVYCGYSSN